MMKRFIWIKIKKIRRFLIYRIFKKETFGVRVALLRNNEVLLVRHTCDDFWTFPGGEIKNNESPREAAMREVFEETRHKVNSIDSLKKLGLYANNDRDKKDSVYFYICHHFEKSRLPKNIMGKVEIDEHGWFNINSLPPVSRATTRRVHEIILNKFENKIIRDW